MREETIAELTQKSMIRQMNMNRIITGSRFFNSAGGGKVCRICLKGFNKKKGRDRVDSSMISAYNIKTYKCAKCFKPESK